MREIKFRAWDKKEKRIRQINMLNADNSENGIRFRSQYYLEGGYTNRPDIELMQYTGLKDKNGKEIYEGDLVQLVKEDGTIYYAGTVFPIKWNDEKARYEPDFGGGIPSNKYEIIGNIYQNPELIK